MIIFCKKESITISHAVLKNVYQLFYYGYQEQRTKLYVFVYNIPLKKYSWPQFLSFLLFSMNDYLDLRQNFPSPFKNGLLHLCTDFIIVVAFFTCASYDDKIITEKKDRIHHR